jgi:hypothetical protein
MVTGIKRGEMFIPKTYKEIDVKPILMMQLEDGVFKQFYDKL